MRQFILDETLVIAQSESTRFVNRYQVLNFLILYQPGEMFKRSVVGGLRIIGKTAGRQLSAF